jgi:ribosomal protein S18 acetylase RimI-like enzyme
VTIRLTDRARIRFAERSDLAQIQAIYAYARTMQTSRGAEAWPEFSAQSILDEIDEDRLLCVETADGLAGVFSIAYADLALWGDRERNEHVYLHRAAKSANVRLEGLVDIALAWAAEHCRAHGRSGLRMDTWASNTTLIAFYESRGFHVVDRIHVGHDARLPPQYQENDFVLLEEKAEQL